MEDKPTYTGMNEAKPNMPDSIPAPPPFPADNAELRIVAAAERTALLRVMAERDALAAQNAELREALKEALDTLMEDLPSDTCSELRPLLARTPAASLAAHDAAVWREAARTLWDTGTREPDGDVHTALQLMSARFDQRAAELEAKCSE